MTALPASQYGTPPNVSGAKLSTSPDQALGLGAAGNVIGTKRAPLRVAVYLFGCDAVGLIWLLVRDELAVTRWN
jgi:hypothetical protein